MLSPVIDEIAKERTDVSVCKVNVDEGRTVAEQYGIFSIPTLIVFKNGKEVSRKVGLRSKDAILANLAK